MLKRIKLKNSTLLFIGILLITFGFTIGFLDYFKEKKEKAFAEMNILLYKTEIPDVIESEQQIEEKREQESVVEPNQEESKNENNEIKYNYIGVLEIPKINLNRGFVSIDSIYNNVDYNITIINGSTFPNVENSNLIFAAHSGICSVCFFDKLFDLSNGDFAYVYYNGIKYQYKLVNTYEVEKAGKVAIRRDYSKSVLTLITCTRYSDTKQTVFVFELDNKENY